MEVARLGAGPKWPSACREAALGGPMRLHELAIFCIAILAGACGVAAASDLPSDDEAVASNESAIAELETDAEQHDGQCSNRTISGDYGGAGEGIILPVGLPFRAVSMTHF